VRRARREVGEEGLVGHQRLLLSHPIDRPVGHVLGEVVALFRRAVRLDRRRAVVDRRRILVGLATDEAVEVLETAAGAGPGVKRAHRARLPHGHLVALTELGGRVAVQLQRLGQRRRGVGPDRAVAGGGGCYFRDAAHADRVVVSAREHGLAGGRAERGGVEAVVLQAVCGEAFSVRRLAWPAKGTRGAEADVVEQDNQHVRGACGWAQRLDRGEGRVWILRVVGDQTLVGSVGNRQDLALRSVSLGAHFHPFP
jgi:hypothetical protein